MKKRKREKTQREREREKEKERDRERERERERDREKEKSVPRAKVMSQQETSRWNRSEFVRALETALCHCLRLYVCLFLDVFLFLKVARTEILI